MKSIIIISGLPRSGTSMMMRMIDAAKIPILTDNIRKADEDNLKGYYEFERVKKLEVDRDWLPLAEGKAVKVISWLLKYLPINYEYKVIFMQRDINEILASQRKRMERRGEKDDNIPDKKMAEQYQLHLEQVDNWMKTRSNIKSMYVSYNDTLKNPRETAIRISDFLELKLDNDKMVETVDLSLYRQRK